MLKAIIRMIYVAMMFFLDGMGQVIFDNKEIVNYSFYGATRVNEKEQKRNVLLEYLKECHKKTYSEAKNGKKDNKKDKDNKPRN